MLGAAVQKIVSCPNHQAPSFCASLLHTHSLWIESSVLTAYEPNCNAIDKLLWFTLGMPRVGLARTLPNDLQVCVHVTNLNRFLVACSL